MTAKLKRLLEASSSSRHPSSHVSIHTALTSTQGGAPQLAGRPHGTRARLAGAHRARGFASRLRRGRATRDLGAPVGRACGRRGQAGFRPRGGGRFLLAWRPRTGPRAAAVPGTGGRTAIRQGLPPAGPAGGARGGDSDVGRWRALSAMLARARLRDPAGEGANHYHSFRFVCFCLMGQPRLLTKPRRMRGHILRELGQREV
mmetsp:Transcript_10717/g.31407  ORF Transcript_10717/g.31407 Transcript_10717/m.31407 type:complete len:202 (+) Transcript_10717:1055-1660(+)